MEINYNSLLEGIVQEANGRKRVSWDILSMRLEKIAKTRKSSKIKINNVFKYFEGRGILSSKILEGYYLVNRKENGEIRDVSPHGYCFTKKEYAENFIEDFYPERKDVFLTRVE